MSDQPVRHLAGKPIPVREDGNIQRLAGKENSQDSSELTVSRLAGRSISEESNVIALPTGLFALSFEPLSATAVTGKIQSRGLKVSAARQKSLYDNRPPIVGMRAMFSTDFYDLETREAVSPTNVKVTVAHGETITEVTLVENSGRIGHYAGSFIPDESGEWTATLKFGSGSEVADITRFYVNAAS